MFVVKIQCEGLSDSEIAKVQSAASKMQYVFNTDAFKNWVLNYSYKYTKGYLWWKKTEIRKCFANNEGLTNFQIYNSLMDGKEILTPNDESGDAEIFLKIDRGSGGSTIGYSKPSSIWQYIYEKFFKKYNVDQVAGNIAHEWCHRIGWHHDKSSTSIRPCSVPYAVGYFVRDFNKSDT